MTEHGPEACFTPYFGTQSVPYLDRSFASATNVFLHPPPGEN